MLQAHRAGKMTGSQTDGHPCCKRPEASCHKPGDCRYSAAGIARGRMMSGRFEVSDGDDDSLLAGSGNGMGATAANLVAGSHTAATAGVDHIHNTTIDRDSEPVPEPGGSCWHRRRR